MIKALYFPVGELPHYSELIPSLDNLQTLVEGNIQVLPIHEEPRAVAIVNEEGRIWDLPVNTYATRRLYRYEPMRGPVLIIGSPKASSTQEDVQFTDIPPELAAFYIARCKQEAEEE